MSFATFEDIVKYAVEKETEAVQFYTEASRQEQYAAAKDTFLAFAEEEKKHKAMFEKFDPAAIAKYEFTNIADLKRSDYMVEAEYKQGMAYPDILRLAMKREENAKKFYDDCVRLAAQEEQKKLFQMLSQEEAKHKLALETLYDDEMAKSGD
ncbi:MAG: ferritin family protein [bacterium]|nr:ferritin family protein [bacterium]